MSSTQSRQISPHPVDADLTALEGVTVLGESAAVLASAFLRMQLVKDHGDGTGEFFASCPDHEAAAVWRAMGRTEHDVPGDERTDENRDGQRFETVMARLTEVLAALDPGRAG